MKGIKGDPHSPHCDAVLGVVQALDGAEDMRERVLRVAAHQREQHARSQQGRLGVPALLREIPQTQAEHEQRRGGGEQQRVPVHGETLHYRTHAHRHRHRNQDPPTVFIPIHRQEISQEQA